MSLGYKVNFIVMNTGCDTVPREPLQSVKPTQLLGKLVKPIQESK